MTEYLIHDKNAWWIIMEVWYIGCYTRTSKQGKDFWKKMPVCKQIHWFLSFDDYRKRDRDYQYLKKQSCG